MTILRKEEHRVLRSIRLSGSILDLGGDKRSEYQKLFPGEYSIKTANMSDESEPDIRCDLEKPLPVKDASYDGVLLINVLEHIFEYRRLLEESARVLKSKGKIVVVVPFLFPYHPSPNDFHRYTSSALERALESAGFSDITVAPLGSGVFAVRWVLIERLLPAPLRALSVIAGPFVAFSDRVLVRLARVLNKKYNASDYALGYVATATRRA
ncbi:MAG: methyltransferase domain-containing protein [Patescibacteria group bacterium]